MTGSAAAGSGPLAGMRVLVPRAPEQAGELSSRIVELGGEVVEAPVLLIEPGDTAAMEDAARDLADGRYEAVCLTSPNGVRALARALTAAGLGADALDGARTVACVGPGTARTLTAELGRSPDLTPRTSTTEALGVAIPPGQGRVLLPRADIASPVLPELLRAKGYEPVEVVAYRTGRPDHLPDEVVQGLRDGTVSHAVVASPSTARNLVALVGDGPLRSRIVSIGPVTSAACRKLGLDVEVEADPHDLDGLVHALARTT